MNYDNERLLSILMGVALGATVAATWVSKKDPVGIGIATAGLAIAFALVVAFG